MFPNVRLLIGTLFIALLVLSCEFGVFAALRVNREPLSRLTSESAPLQLVAGKNALRPVPISWSTPLNAPLAAAQAVEHKVEALALANNDGAADTLNTERQANPAILQTALAPLPPAPVPAEAASEKAAPVAQAPVPAAHTPAPGNEAAPPNPDGSGAAAQEAPAPAIGTAAGNSPPEQTAAVPAAIAAVPEQKMPAAEVVKPAEPAPAQAAPAPQPHATAAQGGEPPASSAPVIAAIAPAAAEPQADQPAEITGSVSNAAIPGTAVPKVEAPPPAKPAPKIVRKHAAQKPHKAARAPAQAHHAIKKRIVRRARTPAAASAQTGGTFSNPVFQSAPQFQRPTKARAGAKNTATNTNFSSSFGSNTFGAQFSPQ